MTIARGSTLPHNAMAMAMCKVKKYQNFKEAKTLETGSSIIENLSGPQESIPNIFKGPYIRFNTKIINQLMLY